MTSCDALVVGGGPAGSTVAGELRRAGLDVVLLDKARFPRDKVCAGWITPAVLDELGVSAESYAAEGRTLQPIRGFRVGFMGRVGKPVRFDEVVSFAVRRCELDDFLLRRSGARLRLGRALESLERSGGGWLANGEIEADMLVGAGGHFCPVARRLGGAPMHDEGAVVAQELEIELTASERRACVVEGEMPELYFADDMKGYGWCVRKGRFLNVGLGRLDRSGLALRARAFVDRLGEMGRVPRRSWRLAGHAYLVRGRSARPPIADGVLLVGDAAGLAYPTSGEGIRPAVESGLLAARAIVAAAGDYRAISLAAYERQLTTRFGPSGVGGVGERVDLPPWKLALARRVVDAPWLCRRLLLERWFLRRHVPPLPAVSRAAAGGRPARRRVPTGRAA